MPDPMEAERLVLEAWKKERAELDSAITVLEKKIAMRGSSGATFVASSGQISSDEFFRLSTPEAIKKFLKIVGRPARPIQDIIDGLKRGGLDSNYTNVYTALTRLQKKGVVKVVDDWGLEEWYPPAPGRGAEPREANGKDELEAEGKSEPSDPLKLKSILTNFQKDGIPLVESPVQASETPKELKEIEVDAPSRKDVVANFIENNGPSTRAEILAGTGIPAGTISYCLNDKHRFVQGENGKWRNVE